MDVGEFTVVGPQTCEQMHRAAPDIRRRTNQRGPECQQRTCVAGQTSLQARARSAKRFDFGAKKVA